MKSNTETESDKLCDPIWKDLHNISKSINSVFHHQYRDLDIIHINILLLLLQFSVISITQIEKLGSFHHRHKTIISKLEQNGCVRTYTSDSKEYSSKKEILSDFYEKGLIIECLAYIIELFNGAVLDMKKWEKLAIAQTPRETKIPYRVNDKTIIVEITDKGRLLLKKYIRLYSTFFTIPIENLSLNKNILGLFAKSLDQLKKDIDPNKYDVLALMIQNAKNRKEKLLSHDTV